MLCDNEYTTHYDRTGSIFDILDLPSSMKKKLVYFQQLQPSHWIDGAARGIVDSLLQEVEATVSRPSAVGISAGPYQDLDQDTKDLMDYIAKAARDRKRIRIRYNPKVQTGQPVYRTVEPYSLRMRSIHVDGYDNPPRLVPVLFGYDAYAETIKMFVIDRIRVVAPRPRGYTARWPVEFESIADNAIDELMDEMTGSGSVGAYAVPLGATPMGAQRKQKKKKKVSSGY